MAQGLPDLSELSDEGLAALLADLKRQLTNPRLTVPKRANLQRLMTAIKREIAWRSAPSSTTSGDES